MYLPPFDAFLQNLHVSKEKFENSDKIAIPKNLLKFMLQILLTNSSIDERNYLIKNPDVEASVKQGNIASGRIHYIGYGFFECRDGATPQVDETWYRRYYPDVDHGIKNGEVGSAAEHFRGIGAAEGRSPNPDALQDSLQWKKAFGR